MDATEFKEKFRKAKPISKKEFDQGIKIMTTENPAQMSLLHQLICMEECGELIQAISKSLRGKGTYDQLLEEMADVIIAVECLKEVYNFSEDDLKKAIAVKMERNVNRIRNREAS